ncbi:hypothetical protein MMPV_003990 [Pyropia vietnamensis]
MATAAAPSGLVAYRLRAELRGHASDVRAVVALPDGGFATASRDATICIWEPSRDGGSLPTESTRVLRGHDHFVVTLAVLPAGAEGGRTLLASGSADKTIRIWDPTTGECLCTMRGHTDAVCSLSAANGNRLVSSSWDKTARVWSIDAPGEESNVSTKCVATLIGHQTAVWDALLLPSTDVVVTCSADRTLKLWNVGSGTCISTVTGHTDVVRALAALPFGGLISVANDSSARLWKWEKPAGLTLSSMASDVHDGNFVYAVDARMLAGSGDSSAVTVASGGEDNTLRVSGVTIGSDGRTLNLQTVQTVTHPGSVWNVALAETGDLITGCSDGVARVFTRDSSRMASSDALQVFEASVAARQVSTKLIGGVDAKKLPLLSEALSTPGVKDGENRMVRRDDGDGAEVHVWSAADSKWSKVGDIVDGPGGGGGGGTSGSGGQVNGLRYDYVFDVDLGEGIPNVKLGYNRGEDTYLAAQRFIDTNSLNQDFLDQVATFIETQVGADATALTTAASSDPLTGGGRYIPRGNAGAAAGAAASNGSPLAAGRYIPGGGDATTAPSRPPPPPRKLIPHPDGFVTMSASDQLDKIRTKLTEFHATLGVASVSDAEIELVCNSLLPKLGGGGGGGGLRGTGPGAGVVSDEECAAIESLLAKWPTSQVFPVLDVARLVVATPSGAACLFGRRNGAALTHVLRHVSAAFPTDAAAMSGADAAAASKASGAVALLGCRFAVNLFHNRVVASTARTRQADILTTFGRTAGAASSPPRARDTFAMLLLNYAVALTEARAPASDRAPVLEAAVAGLRREREEPIAFRLGVALGTLMTGDDKAVTEAAMTLGAAAAVALVASLSPRCQQVATEIATLIAVD